uniref:transketolase isoform X3 n=1 Tax=Jaculus jaculus TaxID=51337 RepID=UPI001E1B1669|nr:transketolase isoform X3 [Jaculus jaculus]
MRAPRPLPSGALSGPRPRRLLAVRAMEGYHKPDQQKLQALKDTANRLRISSIQATTAAGSGHPTSCCSAAEIMAVLFFHTMRYKALDPRNPHNDRFVLSKGHAAPILYAVWAEAGFLPEAELLNLRKINSDLDGHPVPKQAFTDVATGSLGQGLGAACGMAYTGKYFDKASWHTIIVDGHSVEELCKAFGQAKHQPTAIIAKTFKGRGITGVEDKESWHGKPLPKNMADQIIQEIYSQVQSKKKILAAPPQEDAPSVDIDNICMPTPPSYKTGDKIATRKAYGLALAKLGHASDRIIALDGDTKNSTFSELFKKEHPNRFIECYIAEQNMVSIAVGCATRNRTVPFCSTFAAFFTRAFDQIRMAAISESNINLCGSHCGVSIGEDGPSQMALEDLAMFRSIPMSTVFYPSDGVATEKAVELAANTKGICFIRTSRPENAIIYNNNEDFQVGQGKVVLKSKDDQVTVIGAGVTLHEALAAAEMLKKDKISIRVLDPFTIKPLDRKLILESARATKGRILTVEDHYYEGGIGEAVSTEVVGEPGVTVTRLAVGQVPRSGKPAELLKMFGIDKDAIVQAVRGLVTKG